MSLYSAVSVALGLRRILLLSLEEKSTTTISRWIDIEQSCGAEVSNTSLILLVLHKMRPRNRDILSENVPLKIAVENLTVSHWRLFPDSLRSIRKIVNIGSILQRATGTTVEILQLPSKAASTEPQIIQSRSATLHDQEDITPYSTHILALSILGATPLRDKPSALAAWILSNLELMG